MSDEKFLLEYEKLLDNGYCDCNEMNCIDNDSQRRILKIVKNLQQELKNNTKKCVNINTSYLKYASFCEDKIIILEAQQKEFIDWLENLVVSDMGVFTEIKVCDVLSKYKEIIREKKE